MNALAAALALAALAASPCDPDASQSLWQKTLRVLGIPANPGTKGPADPPPPGDLYSNTADGSPARARVTEGGGYRSPVFASDDQQLLALRHDALVLVRTDRGVVTDPEWLMDLPDAVRLAGLSEDDPNLLLVLLEEDGDRRPAVVCLEGRRLARLDANAGQKKDIGKLLKRLRSAERHYRDGDVVVASEKNGEGGRDVVVRSKTGKAGATSADVSKCGRDVCTQGALSRDLKRVVFVRTPSG